MHWISAFRRMRLGMTLTMTVVSILIAFIISIPLILSVGVVFHQCFLFYCVIAWRLERLELNATRLIWSFGVFSLERRELVLSEVTDVKIVRSLLGRLLGYGTLRLEYEGRESGNVREIPFVPKVEEVERLLWEHTSIEAY